MQVSIGPHSFAYDHVYGGDCGKEADVLYDECVAPLVEGLFKGYNATVFAYGQTGSGEHTGLVLQLCQTSYDFDTMHGIFISIVYSSLCMYNLLVHFCTYDGGVNTCRKNIYHGQCISSLMP